MMMINKFLSNSLQLAKAGLIPYVIQKNEPLFMFMIPSDPLYGGTLPSIAKGIVDKGESFSEAAIREAEEELGLIKSNIVSNSFELFWDSIVNNGTDTYRFLIYSCEVKFKDVFKAPHYETGSTRWLTAKEFSKGGRHSQKIMVDALNKLLLKRRQT
jgi:8-oxo-dGTP pyrophosphatase MutT (NUDIX family)